MSNMEKKFEADTGKILDIVINSLYSEREIFVRELISNASDAIDKKKYLALTNKSINDTSDPFEIKIEVNSKENTIKISDNGIGMDEEDLINSLGTIARSGTKAFLEQFNKLQVNTEFLQFDENLPTRIVKVNRDSSGDRYFSGFDANHSSENIRCIVTLGS